MRAAWLLLGTCACAWACSNDFDDYRFRSNESASGGASATGGLGGTSASGGTGGTAATGGTGATGGTAGATGGTGGATGGTAGATGGQGGATGGAGGATGGAGGATGGAGGATGGAGGATGGAAGASGGQGGTGGTVATCEQIYQGDTGVNSICLDTPQVCELNFSSGQATCNAICAAGGGECQGVFDNNGACGHGQVFTCGTNVLNEGVCVCSHGCGSGPPCPSGQTCDNGNCN